MLGLMQDWPLLCHRIIEHAARYHGTQEVVTRSVEGPIHRTTYAQIHTRALKVSQSLERDGIQLGDRVATIAWNTWRHLEVWYGLMGIGAICHTVNPRMFPEQIDWIVNHAQDRIVIADLTFVPMLEKIASQLPSVERYVVLTDKAHMLQTTLKNAVAYEDWIAACDGKFEWKSFDENTACTLCYTSGTTGNPKGVLYSHRSTVLHAFAACAVDGLALSAKDSILVVVPLFHANAWSLPFSAAMCGAKLVLPGPKLDPESIYMLLEQEGCTKAGGIPTIWLNFLAYIENNRAKLDLSKLKLKLVFSGGTNDRMFHAFDAATGQLLWEFPTNSGVIGQPSSFEVNGKQYIAVQSGWGIDSRSMEGRLNALFPGKYPEVPEGGAIWVFAVK